MITLGWDCEDKTHVFVYDPDLLKKTVVLMKHVDNVYDLFKDLCVFRYTTTKSDISCVNIHIINETNVEQMKRIIIDYLKRNHP